MIPEPGQEAPAAEQGASRLGCLAWLQVGTFTQPQFIMDAMFAFPLTLECTCKETYSEFEGTAFPMFCKFYGCFSEREIKEAKYHFNFLGNLCF